MSKVYTGSRRSTQQQSRTANNTRTLVHSETGSTYGPAAAGCRKRCRPEAETTTTPNVGRHKRGRSDTTKQTANSTETAATAGRLKRGRSDTTKQTANSTETAATAGRLKRGRSDTTKQTANSTETAATAGWLKCGRSDTTKQTASSTKTADTAKQTTASSLDKVNYLVCYQFSAASILLHSEISTYRIAGKFGGEFNLADWRICECTAKLNSTNIPWCHLVWVWKLLMSMGVVSETYPTKVPSLSDKQVEKNEHTSTPRSNVWTGRSVRVTYTSHDNYVWHHCSQKQNRQIKNRQMELETDLPN